MVFDTTGSGTRIDVRPRPRDRFRCRSMTRHPYPAVNDNGRYCFSRHGAFALRPSCLFARYVLTASRRSSVIACLAVGVQLEEFRRCRGNHVTHLLGRRVSSGLRPRCVQRGNGVVPQVRRFMAGLVGDPVVATVEAHGDDDHPVCASGSLHTRTVAEWSDISQSGLLCCPHG